MSEQNTPAKGAFFQEYMCRECRKLATLVSVHLERIDAKWGIVADYVCQDCDSSMSVLLGTKECSTEEANEMIAKLHEAYHSHTIQAN